MEAESIFALPGEAFFWFVLTLALNVWILSRGLQRGIEIWELSGAPRKAPCLLPLRGILRFREAARPAGSRSSARVEAS